MQTTTTDPERTVSAFEQDARHAAFSLVKDRIDAGMTPDDARESVKRWGLRLAAKIRRGVEYGAADGMPEHDEGPRHEP